MIELGGVNQNWSAELGFQMNSGRTGAPSWKIINVRNGENEIQTVSNLRYIPLVIWFGVVQRKQKAG